VVVDPAAVAANQWTLDSSVNVNSWNNNWSNAANCTGGAPNGVGAVANLLRRPTASQTVTIDAPVTLGTLNIDNSNSYTLAGSSTITMNVASGSAAINVINRGSHTISAPLVFSAAATLAIDTGSILTASGSW